MDISGKTRLFGLIGSPVEHSKSPAMYNYCFDKWKLDYKYLAFDVDKNQTADAIQAFRTFQMKGANITMPCKRRYSSIWMKFPRRRVWSAHATPL